MNKSVKYEYKDGYVTAKDLREITGRSYKWIYNHLYSCKTIDELIEKAKHVKKDTKYTYKGTTGTIIDMVRISGLKYNTLKFRLYAGWPIEEAIETPSRGKR